MSCLKLLRWNYSKNSRKGKYVQMTTETHYRKSSKNVNIAQLCPTLCESVDSSWNSPGQNTGVGSLSFLQGIFPTQGLNPGFLHCRQIRYQLSLKRNPRRLEWVAYPFCSGSSWPRNQTEVSGTAGGFFTDWAIREAKKAAWIDTKNFLIFKQSFWNGYTEKFFKGPVSKIPYLH